MGPLPLPQPCPPQGWPPPFLHSTSCPFPQSSPPPGGSPLGRGSGVAGQEGVAGPLAWPSPRAMGSCLLAVASGIGMPGAPARGLPGADSSSAAIVSLQELGGRGGSLRKPAENRFSSHGCAQTFLYILLNHPSFQGISLSPGQAAGTSAHTAWGRGQPVNSHLRLLPGEASLCSGFKAIASLPLQRLLKCPVLTCVGLR